MIFLQPNSNIKMNKKKITNLLTLELNLKSELLNFSPKVHVLFIENKFSLHKDE